MTNYAEGTKVEVKVGKNIVQGEIVAIVGETSIQVKNLRTGKVFMTSTARATKLEESAPTEAPTEAQKEETPTVEPAEATEPTEATETPKAVEAPKTEKPRKAGGMSLFKIGIETLKMAGVDLSVTEILKLAEQEGIFNPSDWGSTPEQTLYSAFVRETKVKTEPRVIKAEARGKWSLGTL